MLKVTKGSDVVEIRFDHKFLESYEVEGLTGVYVEEGRRCSVTVVNVNGTQVGQGVSICHPGDNFNKALGRKKSLAEAIFNLDIRLRTRIWKEYENKIGFKSRKLTEKIKEMNDSEK